MKIKLLFLFLLPAWGATAQMWNGVDTLYGNEWIDFSKTYYKVSVASDGLYRIPYQMLADAGFPVGAVPAIQFRLYRYGQQEPVYTTTDGLFSGQDFIEFFGERNRDALDRHLFEKPDQENFNPWYSLFNDTTAYYLSWETGGQPLRYASVVNDLNNVPPKEPFCWSVTGYAYSNWLFKRQISDEVTYSWFNGEGFGTYPDQSFTSNITPRKVLPDGPDAELTVRYACGLGSHRQTLSINDSLIAEDVFPGWRVVQHVKKIPGAWLKPNNGVRVEGHPDNPDRNSVAGIFLRYARQFDFENAATAEWWLDGAPAPKYLEIQSFNANGGAPVLYDLSNRFRLETTVQGGIVKAALPASAAERHIWLVNPSAGIQNISRLQPVQFRDYRSDDAGFIILSNAALFSDPANNGANYVEEYADYRRSPQGGGYKVTVADINELYEQFAYGVRYHPLAVRNFVQYAVKNWTDPRFLLLIGKAINYDAFRNPNTQQALADSLYFVPTYGSPGADELLVMRDKKLSEPLLAVGRLAVVKPDEIRAYLNKLKEHDLEFSSAPQNLAGKAWMKRVIHNSGGLAGETAAIRAYTQSMADEIAGNRIGADVYSFFKTSNDPIQLSSYEQMLELINGGVSLWMIFGHSSPNAVDFDIGAPGVYNNKGRYPLMMIMGCFSGLCSAPQKGIGEQFVLAPDRGAIAYFASVNFSFIDALHTFGRKYYERLGGADYGETIGEVFNHTVNELRNTGYSALVALLHQSLLQGDPAVKMHFASGPDYVIDPQTLRFNPNPVGLEQQTLQIDFDLVNIGENTGGNLPLSVEQRLPDHSVLQRLSDTIPAPASRKTLSYALPTSGSQVGFNRYLLTLDPQNQVAEQPAAAELNNELLDASGLPGVDVYFFADDVSPVAPGAYAIVPQNQVKLQASTLNGNAPFMHYLFEIDTVETFDSPFKKSAEVHQAGGLLEWQPPITLKDSAVYYWRVARDSLVNGQVPWRIRSFICLPGSAPGWNQSHYGQYIDNQFVNLHPVDSTRRLEFADNTGLISVAVAYRNTDRYPGMQNIYYEGFFGDAGFNGIGMTHGVALMVQDPNTGHIVPNLPGTPYNSSATKTKPFFAFDTQDSLQRVALMQFIEHEIPKGFVTGLLALNPYNDTLGYAPRRWAQDSVSFGKNIFQVLEAQGAREVRGLTDYQQVPHPYGFIFRKDDPAFDAVDTLVYHTDSMINIRRNFLAKWSVGQFESPAIGPARSWTALQWQHAGFDDPSDEARVSVLGLREGMTDTLLFTLRQVSDTSLASLSAAIFPRIKLRYESVDTLTRSATQPGYLRVLYAPVPEGALHPAAYNLFYKDTLQQGEKGRFSIAFANVSETAFDSLLVQFRMENDNSSGQDFSRIFRPLPPGDTLHADFQFNTTGVSGKQRLSVDVNPGNAQPERYHFNNTAVREFYVARDLRNPLLDVTFDGAHLLDGDIVSPQPVVVLTLQDDNRFLALQDTGAFTIRLVLPDGSVAPLSYSDPRVSFFPADPAALPQKNKARLEWRPAFVLDGDYRLLVNGRDISGNISGSVDYTVNFRVITKSSISNLLNYPNPFSTSTCFVYTMTGAEAPATFRIQIMTVAGRVVREITEAEFGPMRAGTHRSDFCWDGRDQFGDRLANGVYLYRVIAKKSDGAAFDLFENEPVDGFFKGGFGKMVLLR